jgi:hypothetical protein
LIPFAATLRLARQQDPFPALDSIAGVEQA